MARQVYKVLISKTLHLREDWTPQIHAILDCDFWLRSYILYLRMSNHNTEVLIHGTLLGNTITPRPGLHLPGSDSIFLYLMMRGILYCRLRARRRPGCVVVNNISWSLGILVLLLSLSPIGTLEPASVS